jgi:DNA polymerase-3 subunit delta
MVAVKTHQAHAFLVAPDKRIDAFLFFGPDNGLVVERAQILARVCAESRHSSGEMLRLDDSDLDSDPDRLTVELKTVSMFGGAKIVRATAGRRINAAALKSLIEDGPLEGVLIVEAGNLKPDDALRQLFEKSSRAAAVACYADGVQELEGLVREILTENGLAIASDARQALIGRLGADRGLSRGEVEKLALYARGKREIDMDDVEAVVGDAAELALERVYYAAASGDGSRAVAEASRAVSSGEGAQAIIAATQRHFQRLHRARAAVEEGRNLDDVLRQLRPPLHFKQRDAFAAQCRAWTCERLAEALRRIAMAAKAARLRGSLEEALTERMLLSLSRLAAGAREAVHPQR